jgi:lipopolysaccharide/colanic/teichoic acid biosynthesis glycosyltransferase
MLNLAQDLRVTKIDKIIWKRSIDVLRGEMSLVGTKYIDEWSIWLDVKILFKTVAVVVARKGAR